MQDNGKNKKKGKGRLQKFVKLYKEIDTGIGRQVFGNTASFTKNFEGGFRKKMIYLGQDSKKNLHRKPSEFELTGYYKLKKSIDNSIMTEILSKHQNMIEDDEYSFPGPTYKGKYYTRHLKRPYRDIPEFSKLLTHEIIETLEEYYHGYFKVELIECGRNYSVPLDVQKEKEFFSSRWHNDRQRTYYTKLFVNLSDVTDNDGPSHIMTRSRTTQLLKMGFKNRVNYNLPIEVVEDKKYLFKGTGTIGTAYLCNPQLCFHRAGMPAPNHQRDLITLRFEPSKTPLQDDWINYVNKTFYEET